MAELRIALKVVGLNTSITEKVHAGSELELVANVTRAAVETALQTLVGGESSNAFGNVFVSYEVGIDHTTGGQGGVGFLTVTVCVRHLPDEVGYNYLGEGAPAQQFGLAVITALQGAFTTLPNFEAFMADIGLDDIETQLGIGSSVTLYV